MMRRHAVEKPRVAFGITLPHRFESLIERGKAFGYMCPLVISRYISKGLTDTRKAEESAWIVSILRQSGVAFLQDSAYEQIIDDDERLVLKIEERFSLPADLVLKHLYSSFALTIEEISFFLEIQGATLTRLFQRFRIPRRENDVRRCLEPEEVVEEEIGSESKVQGSPIIDIKKAQQIEQEIIKGNPSFSSDLNIIRPLDQNERIRLRNAIRRYLHEYNVTSAYLLELAQFRLLQPEEERLLSCRLIQGQAKAMDQLILANLRLVVWVAKRHYGQGLEFIDLIQEGSIGLMKAVKMYDPSLGYRFSTYATWWIDQACSRAVMDFGSDIRLPAHRGEELNKIRVAQYEFNQFHGRMATAYELSEMTGIDPDVIKNILRIAGSRVSLNQPLSEFGDEEDSPELLETALIYRNIDPLVLRTAHTLYTDLQTHVKRIREALRQFSFEDQLIIICRSGLFGIPRMTLEEIGEKHGVTRQRIRQVEKSLLEELGGEEVYTKQYLQSVFQKLDTLDEVLISTEAS